MIVRIASARAALLRGVRDTTTPESAELAAIAHSSQIAPVESSSNAAPAADITDYPRLGQQIQG